MAITAAVRGDVNIAWGAVATIAAPIIALFVGVWITRRFESPSLLSYFGHVSAFRHNPPGGPAIDVYTHSVVLRNAGRRAATNVRISHVILPDFNIAPETMYRIEQLPTGGKDIVIPTLVPGEQITVSYLYFPPMTVANVNAGIKSDQGLARVIPVFLQRQYPRWFNGLAFVLMLTGFIASLYLAYEVAARLWYLWRSG